MSKNRQNVQWTVVGEIHIYYRLSYQGTSHLYSVGQLESKQPATILLDKGVRWWSLAEWLKLVEKILERMGPHTEVTCKSAYKLSYCLGWLWTVHVEGRLSGPGEENNYNSKSTEQIYLIKGRQN